MFKPENKKVACYLLGIILTTFLIYYSSLFRPWQPFDERIIYQETFFPIPIRFGEIFEVINTFILKSHILSSNIFFSNISTLRSNPITFAFIVFISFFFQKNAFFYHCLQLFIHLINITLVYLILKKSLSILTYNQKDTNHTFSIPIISLFTLLWGLHSANTEAVLLVTNLTAVLTYTFCFSFILYEISKIEKNILYISKGEISLISLLFFILMFLTEYGYTLPIILFFLIFSFTLKNSSSVNKAITISFKKSLPYFIGMLFYILFSLINPDSTLNNLFKNQGITSSLYIFFERNLWLSPQIFIDFLKLLVFPKTLSTYQSNLIYLSNSLFNPYSVFCLFTYLFFLITPLILFFTFKKSKNIFLCPLFYAFYFSLFPFLHILTPSYCLIADRYCYFPLFFLLLFIYQLLLSFNKRQNLKPVIFFLFSLLVILALRTYIRINEWNNPYTFFQSTINADKTPLYKAYKFVILANYASSEKNQPLKESSINKSIELLNESIKNYTHKEKIIEPVTLKIYGLDSQSLLLKTVYLIATIKNDYSNENPRTILAFYEPYIKEHIDLAGINQLLLYASILSKDQQLVNAKRILEYAFKRYPFSPEIMKSLANFYFYEKDFKKLEGILSQGYKLFPNDIDFIRMLYNYYKLTSDRENENRFAYLIRLREHLTVIIK